jgi:Flp pilus assembly protein TadD
MDHVSTLGMTQAMGTSVDTELHLSALRHFEAGQLGETSAICHRILATAPGDWVALRLLGAASVRQGAFAAAVPLLKAALDNGPPDKLQAIALLNELGDALRGCTDYVAALECYRRALTLDPREANSLQNCGSTLVLLNRHAEALEHYRLARSVRPDMAELEVNEGLTMLALGMWPEAWRLMEARLSVPSMHAANLFPSGIPYWRGETDIRGQTILLHADQGFGDTIQHVRYARLVAERGAHVVLRVPPALAKLLAEVPGAHQVITFDDAVPAVDLQCPLMSLPLVFNTTSDNVPAPVPYLHARSEYLLVWRVLLGRATVRRIGIAWAGRPQPPMRSMPVVRLASLLMHRDVEFHPLLPTISATDRAWLAGYPNVVDHGSALKDFADTAAVITQMDLVITIDTAVAHLAGALGRPVWIMLPSCADGRWLIGRSDTPWYPSARLFRQSKLGDWSGVLADVLQALSHV